MSGPKRRSSPPWIVLVGLIALAAVVRVWRLDWQPLWWDEGYSVYFATEPLARMVALTARDIHPPLYYALLHIWTGVFGATPPALRTLSILAGLAAVPTAVWLAARLYPARRRVTVLVGLLLAFSPLHLFYSQEVRMYGLAMLMGMVATGLFWELLKRPRRAAVAAYAVTAALGLYTLYYLGFLLLAHALYGIWAFRRSSRRLVQLATAYLVAAMLYLPWLLYAAPRLVAYVGDKVVADQDTPLTLPDYLFRHVSALGMGHLRPEGVVTTIGLAATGLAVLLPVLGMVARRVKAPRRTPGLHPAPTLAATDGAAMDVSPAVALWTFVLVPFGCGFLLNLRLPFFPAGGERVLLFTLPYALLLLAAAMDHLWSLWQVGKIALAAAMVAGAVGIGLFYRTPRYVEHDYRPLIGQTVQQGHPGDTFFAIFPWQVGYWRAYVPRADAHRLNGPDPQLAADGALTWSPALAAAIDQALVEGTLWFPEPLSFGSTLPDEIDAYLHANAANLLRRWYSETTRLSAWHRFPQPVATTAMQGTFGPLHFQAAGVAPAIVTSANEALGITLAWEATNQEPATWAANADNFFVTLRLVDENNHAWAVRDYTPPGSLGRETEATDHAGFIVPVGLPPGAYTVAVGVGDKESQVLLSPSTVADGAPPLQPLATIQVREPAEALPVERLPIQFPQEQPPVDQGLALLGHAGATDDDPTLAGDELAVTLFFQNRSSAPPPRQLYLSLLNQDGAGVAGWEGWPLPTYPTEIWPAGALVQVPAAFYLPATLESGAYTLIAGLLDPISRVKSAPAELGVVLVRQRVGNFSAPSLDAPLTPIVRFGTHAQLMRYAFAPVPGDATSLDLTLDWQAYQSLLPPHHIFVHVVAPDGTLLAQEDAPPSTAEGLAPTGSWQPGEYLSTVHRIQLPGSRAALPEGTVVRVGLYNPDGNIRLPLTLDGAPAGDALEIPLSMEPR